MFKVILDCDNTMGVKRSDIDDGLTFGYLRAHPDVEILGLTCTFANNHEHVVYYNTKQMFEDLGITDVPFFRGGRNAEDYDSESVDFLVKTARENKGEINVIAIGSLCNIAGAYTKDPEFFDNIKHLYIMGGITEDLYLNGVLLNELNFTVDYKSAAKVIYNCKKMSVLSSQCTQDAFYGADEMDKLLAIDNNFIKYSMPIIRAWIKHITPQYGHRPVFINWDLCAAVYMIHKDWFEPKTVRVVKNEENMKKGLMQIDEDGKYSDDEVNLVDIPTKITNLKALNEEFYDMLSRLD